MTRRRELFKFERGIFPANKELSCNATDMLHFAWAIYDVMTALAMNGQLGSAL